MLHIVVGWMCEGWELQSRSVSAGEVSGRVVAPTSSSSCNRTERMQAELPDWLPAQVGVVRGHVSGSGSRFQTAGERGISP